MHAYFGLLRKAWIMFFLILGGSKTAKSDVGSQWELPNDGGLPFVNEMQTKIFGF